MKTKKNSKKYLKIFLKRLDIFRILCYNNNEKENYPNTLGQHNNTKKVMRKKVLHHKKRSKSL
jgi:hypothetical protein